MGWIENNYSIFNCYHYDGKPKFDSLVDYFASPVSRVLGGRNVYLMWQTHDNGIPALLKVITAVFFALVFPLGIVSVLCFALKCITRSQNSEKKKIDGICFQVWESVEKFQVDPAIAIVLRSPDIDQNGEIKNKFYGIVEKKIQQNVSWKKLQKLLFFLPPMNAISLCSLEIAKRLKQDLKDNCFKTGPDEIATFIHSSLAADKITHLQCLRWLLFDKKSSLRLNENDSQIIKGIKLCVADYIINQIILLESFNTQFEKDNENIRLRQEFANIHSGICNVFKDRKRMALLSLELNGICLYGSQIAYAKKSFDLEKEFLAFSTITTTIDRYCLTKDSEEYRILKDLQKVQTQELAFIQTLSRPQSLAVWQEISTQFQTLMLVRKCAEDKRVTLMQERSTKYKDSSEDNSLRGFETIRLDYMFKLESLISSMLSLQMKQKFLALARSAKNHEEAKKIIDFVRECFLEEADMPLPSGNFS